MNRRVIPAPKGRKSAQDNGSLISVTGGASQRLLTPGERGDKE